jgi:hypothetical protein
MGGFQEGADDRLLAGYQMVGITPMELVVLVPMLVALGLTAFARATLRISSRESVRLSALTLLVPGVGAAIGLVFVITRLRHPGAVPGSHNVS